MIFIEKKILSILQTPRKCRNTLLYNSINSPWDLGHMGIKKRHFQALNQHGFFESPKDKLFNGI